jgi:hypothetical protein
MINDINKINPEITTPDKQKAGMISSYDYNKMKKILCLTFNDGYVYQYFNIPENVHAGFINSPDPDFYFRSQIRNQYKRLLKRYDNEVMK